MVRALVIVAILHSVAALAEPRVAVHPLELGNFTLDEREALKAQFQVMVARVPKVTLAGSSRIDDALSKSAAARCDVRDSCLRFLAEATDSLYGMYVRLDAMAGGAVISTARVVRSDGATVRKVRVDAENARSALLLTVTELKLDALESTLPAGELRAAELTPPPLPAAQPEPRPGVEPEAMTVTLEQQPRSDWKPVAGWSLLGVGGATVATGVVFAALAASGAAAHPPDSSGLVSPDQAAGAALALEQSNIAAILIPTGAAVAVVGAILVLWPKPSGPSSLSLAVVPTHGGLAASISGRLP